MFDNRMVDAALRELDDATGNKPDPKAPKQGETDWKAMNDREYRDEMKRKFGLDI